MYNPQGRISKHLNQDVITGISIATELRKKPFAVWAFDPVFATPNPGNPLSEICIALP